MSPTLVALALLPCAQAQAWSVMSYNAQFRPYVAGIELGTRPARTATRTECTMLPEQS
jgi:hypothetical protein